MKTMGAPVAEGARSLKSLARKTLKKAKTAPSSFNPFLSDDERKIRREAKEILETPARAGTSMEGGKLKTRKRKSKNKSKSQNKRKKTKKHKIYKKHSLTKKNRKKNRK